MAPSSTSLPASPLPFGADTHTYSAWRRSLSVSRAPNGNADPIIELYKNTNLEELQDYPGSVAATRVSDIVLHRTSASIAPSSINDLPHRIKKVLKRHTIQLWILAAVFELMIIVLTIAVTLGACTANSSGHEGTKCAAVILGLIGLLGAISCVAVGWLIWRGRQVQARLEKQWIADEELKERSLGEEGTEEMVLKGIRDRERSLSMSRGRGRESAQKSEQVPSFKDLTPPPTPPAMVDAMPTAEAGIQSGSGSENDGDRITRHSTWTHHLNLEDEEDEEDEYIPPVPPINIPPQSSNRRLECNELKNGDPPPVSPLRPPASLDL